MQEKKLQDEIHQLDADVQERDIYIDSRKKEIELLQSLISQSRDGFNDYKAQRDKLQDERKYEFVTLCLIIKRPELYCNFHIVVLTGSMPS